MEGFNNLSATLGKIIELCDTGRPTAEQKLKWIAHRIDELNAVSGHLSDRDGFDCPLCRNKGRVYYLREDNRRYLLDHPEDCGLYNLISSKKCQCHSIRQDLMRAKRSGLGFYVNKTIDDYRVLEPWQQIVKAKVEKYCAEETEKPTWCAFLGQSGAGKTLAASIIANYLLRHTGQSIRYYLWPDLVNKLKRSSIAGEMDYVIDMIYQLKHVDVLYLDEVLKERKEADLAYLIDIINYRYNNNLKTIITSELLPNQLLAIDEALGSRIIERCGPYLVSIGPGDDKSKTRNYRLRNVQTI